MAVKIMIFSNKIKIITALLTKLQIFIKYKITTSMKKGERFPPFIYLVKNKAVRSVLDINSLKRGCKMEMETAEKTTIFTLDWKD